jgi:glycosyltransferase involved in cell wall biosynthesis
MKVSIITVTKDAEKTIKDCINSVNLQTYKNIEHIIIDGNSKDKTLSIINEIPQEKQCIILSESDLGIYDAINKGILKSSGDVIGLLHADDFFTSKFIVENMVSYFKTYQVDALFAKVTFVDKQDSTKIKRIYSSKFFKPWAFRFGFSPAHPTFYVKKNIFQNHGMYRKDLAIAGDFEFMLRVLYLKKITFKYIDECWVTMRLGGISTSGVNSIIKNNREILKSCKLNSVYTNYVFIYSKYLYKWIELFKRK